MTFLELAQKRYSVRSYENKPVEDAKLKQILEAGRLAPTGANLQQFQLVVVHTAGRQEELKPIYKPDWFANAPVLICVCATTPTNGQPYREAGAYRNVSIVTDHIILAATELGLGTCWVAAFDQEATRRILKIPADAYPINFIAVGYAKDQPKPKTRKPIEELVRYEHW